MEYLWGPLTAEVLNISIEPNRQHWSIPYRRNAFNALWIVERGRVDLIIDGKRESVPEGGLVLLPVGVPFQAYLAEGCASIDLLVIRFHLRIREQIDWFALYRLPTILSTSCPKAWRKLFHRIQTLHTKDPSLLDVIEGNSTMELFLINIMRALENQIQPIQTLQNHKYFQVSRMIDWMEQHLSRPFQLDDLAAMTHLSSDYVNDLFTSIVHTPPMRYANLLRIKRARQYLAQTNWPIQEIGTLVGIDDAHYFSRLFRKYEGMSPSQYRATLREMDEQTNTCEESL